jgi:hypothetical protein
MTRPVPDGTPPPTSGSLGLEMVSGPDLGAGFLFQLTLERLPGPVAHYLFHAQDGGADASGPPMGTPEPLGWRRPAGMCPIGGRVCWHRDFWLPDAALGPVRASYNRTRFVMEESLKQVYRGRPVPLEPALEELLRKAPGSGSSPPIEWSLAGATALWLQGAPNPPKSIEIETTEAGVRAWAERLEEYLIEPPGPTTWHDGARRFGARAFVGTLREGARVEWSDGGAGHPGNPGPIGGEGARWVDWKGHPLSVRTRR